MTWEREPGISPAEIAWEVGIRASGMARTFKRMEKKNHKEKTVESLLGVPSVRASISTKALVALVGKERRRSRGTI